jgi:putative SbcD/Mre11-related phosphoesterase
MGHHRLPVGRNQGNLRFVSRRFPSLTEDAEMPTEIRISPDMTLSPLGCAFHAATGALLLADLHIGYEATLESEGFAMPRMQTLEMISRLHRAIDSYDPSMVVVAGDLKHNFDRNLTAEWNGVERFVDEISGRAKLVVLKGNHDNYLATILSKRGMQLHKELEVGGFTVAHGHETRAAKGGGMILAHEHPAIMIRESTGAKVKVPCFLYNASERRLVLPAFSPLALGSDVIGTPDSERMIPLLAETGLADYAAYGFYGGEILNYKEVGKLRGIGRI